MTPLFKKMGNIVLDGFSRLRGKIYHVPLDDGNQATIEALDYGDSTGGVLVIALTPEDNLILVRQFRFAAEAFTLEPPGGCRDESDATIEEAGRRELLEETGYAAGEVVYANQCWLWSTKANGRANILLAFNCHKVQEPEREPAERAAGMEVLEVGLVTALRGIAEANESSEYRDAKLAHGLIALLAYRKMIAGI